MTGYSELTAGAIPVSVCRLLGSDLPNKPLALSFSARSMAFASPGRAISDDCAEGNSHALTCGPDSNSDRLTCGHRMRECRSLPCSRVLESDGLDATTEKCMPLFQAIECGVQLHDNCVCLISDDNQFDIDLFV
jgi:hypothetical protein